MDDDDEMDEEALLQQALKLSMMEGIEEPEPKPEQAPDLKDLVTTDLLKGIISEMNLDIDAEAAMEDIMNGLDKKGEKKPEEEKKE